MLFPWSSDCIDTNLFEDYTYFIENMKIVIENIV